MAKRTPVKRVPRMDDFVNAFTGLGTVSDKRTAAKPTSVTLDRDTEAQLWQSDAMAARIVEKPADDMIRAGFTLNVKGDKDTSEEVMDQLDELDAMRCFYDARCLERAHGGGAILVGANDGLDTRLPLNEKAIKSIEFLTVLGPAELTAENWNTDLRGARFGRPEIWKVVNPISSRRADVFIHDSRLITFEGIQTGRKQVRAHRGWGGSVLSRCYSAIRDFDLGYSSTAALIPDFAQAVWKMKGLMDLVASGDNASILARIKAMEVSRSIVNATLLDAEGEDFKRETTTVAGLSDLLVQFCNRLAASASMPVSLLMGQAPAGLNATGDSDIRWYYDEISSQQEQRLRPRLNKLLKLMLLARLGPTRGIQPDSWTVTFNPLWQPTDQQKAATRLTVAQADQIYLAARVLEPEEVAISRYGGDAYSAETTIDAANRRVVEPPTPEPVVPVVPPAPPTE